MCARLSANVRELAENRAEKAGATRFFRNPKVSVEEIIATAAKRTAEAARGRRILLIQDTTEINYEAKAGRQTGLGTVGNGTDRGLFLHAALALDAEDGTVLGLASAQIYRRSKKKHRHYQTQPIEDKESFRWIETAQKASAALPDATRITDISDRESDIYEVFARVPDARTDVLVRITYDRALEDGGNAFATLAEQKEGGRIEFDLSARAGRPARKVALAVRFACVRIRQPKTGASTDDPPSISLTLVEACEGAPPNGEKPVLWRLATNRTIVSFEDAAQAIDDYRKRWTVEQVFRTLKTQGVDIEESLLGNGSALERIAAAAVVSATQVMQLVYARGEEGRRFQASRVFGSTEIAVLKRLIPTLEGKTEKQMNPHSTGTLAWASWCIARLGGWNGYQSERPPGPLTFSRGFKRFHYIVEGVTLMQTRNPT